MATTASLIASAEDRLPRTVEDGEAAIAGPR
jgi:hypothetical protein